MKDSVADTGSDVKLKFKVKIIHFIKQDVSHWIHTLRARLTLRSVPGDDIFLDFSRVFV
jgi:hypothetical protein